MPVSLPSISPLRSRQCSHFPPGTDATEMIHVHSSRLACRMRSFVIPCMPKKYRAPAGYRRSGITSSALP